MKIVPSVPVPVVVIGALHTVGGVLLVVLALVTGYLSLVAGSGALLPAVAIAALGLLYYACGRALSAGQRWARFAVAGLSLVGGLAGGWVALHGGPPPTYAAALHLAAGLYLALSPSVARAFRPSTA